MAIRACVVERPLNAPNCLGSRLPATFGCSCLSSEASNNLLRVGVSEVGLRSSWMVCGGWDFGIGTTFAHFMRSGTNPLEMEALKIWHTGSAITKAKSFKNHLGMSSGPGDL
jgi:hypothetical protein